MRPLLPQAPCEPYSIIRLTDGRLAIATGFDPAHGLRVLVDGAVEFLEAAAVAEVIRTPAQLAQAYLEQQRPAKVVTVAETEAGHVASVQVGPSPEVFAQAEGASMHEALGKLAEAVLVEVQQAERT